MIRFTQGNLLESQAEALVNTVNTIGVMGKGIALMFKERFPLNTKRYVEACKRGEVRTGEIFAVEINEIDGPRWVINFPTKESWRNPSRMEWIDTGLVALKRFLVEHQVKSIAIPPLGAGNGGLDWADVRPRIEAALADLDIDIIVFEPTAKYQNVAKRHGVETLTPARALIAELVRRYWVLGLECSLLEIQKLAWFMERTLERAGTTDNPLSLQFVAHKYGPYAQRLDHLLDRLDGSYLNCDKRIKDADPLDVIWFNDARAPQVKTYLSTEAKEYLPALEVTSQLIDGFESPYGLELLATVDWLLAKEHVAPDVASVRAALQAWPAGADAAKRKLALFDERALGIALERLTTTH